MKKLLALFLAVAMVAAGNVLALAEEAAPEVMEDAPITVGGRLPGETIRTTWSVYMKGGTTSFQIETPRKIVADPTNINENITVRGRVVMGVLKQVSLSFNRKLTKEDIGTFEEDVVSIKLDDGNTYSFPFRVEYVGPYIEQMVESSSQIKHFVVGTPAVIPLEIIDPDDLIADYTVEVAMRTIPDNVTVTGEDRILRVDNIERDGKAIKVHVTPTKKGMQHINIYATPTLHEGEFGGKMGSGWDIEVINPGEEFTPDKQTLVESDNVGPTDNAANSSETTDAIREATDVLSSGTGELPKNAVSVSTASGATMTAIPVKLSSGSAALSLDTANVLGDSSVALSANVDNGAMEVVLPGGFGQINEPGRIYFPLDLNTAPSCAEEMKAAVKGDEDTRTEAIKAGGDMTLPATATITLKTKLEGTVNVYYYNEDTRRFTKLATTSAKEGKVTFATKQMGHLVLTTGTI